MSNTEKTYIVDVEENRPIPTWGYTVEATGKIVNGKVILNYAPPMGYRIYHVEEKKGEQ